jgi:hypothetical protein
LIVVVIDVFVKVFAGLVVEGIVGNIPKGFEILEPFGPVPARIA